MKTKNTYVIPSVEVQSLETEGLIAQSVLITDETTDDDARMSRRHEIWK